MVSLYEEYELSVSMIGSEKGELGRNPTEVAKVTVRDCLSSIAQDSH